MAEQLTAAPTDLPMGSIILWYGEQNTIPKGWVICDGTQSTPDLRGRFVVGTSDDFPVGNTGGRSDIKLNPEHLPPHSHEYSEWQQQDDDWKSGGESSPNNGTGGNQSARTKEAGSGEGFSILPPYYSLNYIMKRQA